VTQGSEAGTFMRGLKDLDELAPDKILHNIEKARLNRPSVKKEVKNMEARLNDVLSKTEATDAEIDAMFRDIQCPE
jgi:hypothetical protein